MTTGPLFCGIDLAQRIESGEAELTVAATTQARRRGAKGLVLPVAGGFACFADDGSPMNKVIGLGFAGVPDTAVLSDIEDVFAGCGTPVQVELSNLADPDIAALLSARGYQLVGFENVLGRSLNAQIEDSGSAGIEIRPIADGEFDSWMDVVVQGFAHPDGVGVPSHEEFPHDIITRAMRDIHQAGAVSYLALCAGVVAGGGSMRLADGVAQLTGAATDPGFRRRGVQTALLTTRLSDAANAGCDIAVVTTAPGSTSQKNVQNKGFQLLYTRAVLVKTH